MKQPGQGNVVTVSAKQIENLMLHRHRKDNLSEMPAFLSGGLTISICGEEGMLSAAIRKMFHLCMPVLFGGMAQCMKLYKIPVSKRDICKYMKSMLNAEAELLNK